MYLLFLGEIYNVDTTVFELGEGVNPDEVQCPRNWVRYENSCYKFTRSPIKRWDDARLICQAFRHQDTDHSDLASISSLEEHRFITAHLNRIDPQHRRWYLSTRQEDQNKWVNQGDRTQMLNLNPYFLASNEWGEAYGQNYKKDYLVYAYSDVEQRWGFRGSHYDHLHHLVCFHYFDCCHYYYLLLNELRIGVISIEFVRKQNHVFKGLISSNFNMNHP